MSPARRSWHFAVIVLVAATSLLAAACGSTSTTSTAPTPASRCQVTLSTPGPFAPAGGTGTIDVITERECEWTASTQTSWITRVSPRSGRGAALVEFDVASNPAPVPRQGEIVINDVRMTIRQDLAPCAYQVSPRVASDVPAAGASRTASVTVASGCAWTAASNVSWIAVTTGATGDGDGSVSFTIGPNSGPPRTGTLTIAGQTFTVNQVDGCTFEVQPTSISISSGGGSRTLQVTSGQGCAWSAVVPASTPWIAVKPASGSGNGSVTLDIAATSGPQRNGSVQIAGRTIQVTQSSGCAFNVDPSSISAAAGGGGGAITLSTEDGCAWTAASNEPWISVSPPAGTGSGAVAFTIGANAGPARSGTFTVAGNTIAVTQASGCTFGVSPTSLSLGAAAGSSATVNVSTADGCEWEAVSHEVWIGITAGALGNGNGTVSISLASNAGPLRTGTLTVAGQTVTVTQASGCSLTVQPGLIPVGAGFATGSFSVNTAAGCDWTAASNAPWIGITSGSFGSGPGTVGFNAAANTGPQRTGTITVSGSNVTRTVTVTQASGCTYTVAPTTFNLGAGAVGSSMNVTAPDGCIWSAVSNDPWITVNTENGAGAGKVGFSVAANTGPARSGTMLVAGQTITVNQASGCSPSATPTSISVPAAGGPQNVTVSAGAGCQWTAVASPSAPWITNVSPASGSGPGKVGFNVQSNPGPQRVGTLTVAGSTITVTQANGCSFKVDVVSPLSLTFGTLGGLGTVNVTASAPTCTWTATVQPGATWITIVTPPGGNGTGSGTVTFSVAPNIGKRSANITVAGQVLMVTQG